jgi:hypothetical protein
MNMNQILDKHQKVTVPLTMVTLIGGGVILAVIGVTIWRGIKERRETAVMLRYVTQRQDILYNREEPNNQGNQLQPRAPPPERDMIFPDPPPYNGQSRGRPPVAAGQGCSLGMDATLRRNIEEFNRTTTGHSLGMNESELIETGARTRGAFDLGGDQEATRNYPRAPAKIDMIEMLRRK